MDPLDPTKIGEALGQAQSIQQVLGICIGFLLVVCAGLVKLWTGDRKAHAEEKEKDAEALKARDLQAQKDHDAAIADLKRQLAEGREKGRADLATARAGWERERADFIQRERDLIAAHTEKLEEKHEQTLKVALACQRALDKVVSQPPGGESGHGSIPGAQ